MIRKRYWVADTTPKLLSKTRFFVDYTDPATNRTSAVLELKDISLGSGDSFTIETSDTGNYTWTEGTDFSKTSDERTTAEAIAAAINSTSNFTANAVTGYPGNSFVYIHYTAAGYLTSAYSGDANAWAFYEVNATNGTIRTVYADDSGTIKTQPFFSNHKGFVSFWVADGSGKFDVEPYKSGVPTDSSYFTEYSP